MYPCYLPVGACVRLHIIARCVNPLSAPMQPPRISLHAFQLYLTCKQSMCLYQILLSVLLAASAISTQLTGLRPWHKYSTQHWQFCTFCRFVSVFSLLMVWARSAYQLVRPQCRRFSESQTAYSADPWVHVIQSAIACCCRTV